MLESGPPPQPASRLAAEDLRADCTRCAGLCCVAPTLFQSDDFAIDKPAGVPCPHLGGDNRCGVYGQRSELGFRGCIAHDCFGAGQRVSQEVFGGRSWRDDPTILPAMSEAFFSLREIHGFVVMLDAARKLPLAVDDRGSLDSLIDELSPGEGWTEESLIAYEHGDLAARTKAFLKTLRPYFENHATQ